MTGAFDGHANCFVESGDDKALLIDFNYDTEPLPGRYPVPGIGPGHGFAFLRSPGQLSRLRPAANSA